jgi:hypothetical protein
MNQQWVNMSHFFVVVRAFKGWLLPGISCLALAGCSAAFSPHTENDTAQSALPQHQVADFLSVDCADIWSLKSEASDKNPLYWLRGIDCADRLAPVQARAEAKRHDDDSWQDAFKRGILLADAKITPDERRALVSRLDTFSPQIAMQVRPLYQLWRDGQNSQLQLVDERARYAKLQQSSDSELETLRLQEQQLRSQLELTTRKLENLTDIERQLSSRKPGEF